MRANFVPTTTHKRDEFSETVSGHLEGEPETKLVLRKLDGVPFWAKPIAGFLARKEVRSLRIVTGITGTPDLIRVDDEGILRSWSDGIPLNLAKPDDAAYYKDAKRILREMRRRNVTHNDLAKPQNWLMAPDGTAAVIDFQLASVHRRKGWMYRTMAYEDLRHLVKQKGRYAKDLLTASERKILRRKSLPTRIWMATGKRLYNGITRGLFNWSDGEGTGNRIAKEGADITANLMANDAVTGVRLSPFALPAKGMGIYAFVETKLDSDATRALIADNRVELIQPVTRLPREDVAELVAMNRLDELEFLLGKEPQLRADTQPIVDARLNLTDRRLAGL
ncbi:serine/threonine protein kinase [Octadecabacter sp. 1_MG-2023]|uniref:serine/threonine protein kinase n=1 Tax=unclassified Octadecabacter TaxID=196158 RepID=UPI001C08AF57|nr:MULTISPECIES: serine/threonine protein kinase [unclassified Octadecabacter]MBU2992128.1 serine/threonine protein kinase [Octadecabacter sp. B2R22]MDO6735116.1 serine/threonine protein kinase [Octadecabacter sp. 1_MG-2023]